MEVGLTEREKLFPLYVRGLCVFFSCNLFYQRRLLISLKLHSLLVCFYGDTLTEDGDQGLLVPRSSFIISLARALKTTMMLRHSFGQVSVPKLAVSLLLVESFESIEVMHVLNVYGKRVTVFRVPRISWPHPNPDLHPAHLFYR